MKHDYNVVIIGGGLAGTATALALLQSGIGNVLIVESGNYQQIKVGESLAPDAGAILTRLGLDDNLLDQRYLRSPGHRSYWGSNTAGTTDFATHPFGEGWHIDRRDFEQHLAYKASTNGADVVTSATLLNSSKCESATRQQLLIQTTEGTTTVHCRFAVDATGYRGRLATTFGHKATEFDKQLFICGFFELPGSSTMDSQTMIESVEDGWWYRARLPDNKLIISLATCPMIYKSKRLYKWQQWLDELAISSFVGQSLSDVKFNPESIQLLSGATYLRQHPCEVNNHQQTHRSDWISVGDASMGIDPIFGRGMVNALESGADAGSAIAAWLKGDSKPLHQLKLKTRQTFAEYQSHRSALYEWEQRWPESPFWSARTNDQPL